MCAQTNEVSHRSLEASQVRDVTQLLALGLLGTTVFWGVIIQASTTHYTKPCTSGLSMPCASCNPVLGFTRGAASFIYVGLLAFYLHNLHVLWI